MPGKQRKIFLPPFREGSDPSWKGQGGIDLLPEATGYKDDGCFVHPQCLSCPLPRCIYDEPDGGRAMLKALRDGLVRRAHREERLSIEELAERFSLSKRSIYRILGGDGR